ncbi:DUF1801 domain-containing protein [Rheinheimera salexigens]|uniref:YdhG-like domain-containing protein n=1 Tax=Rheinheimera salexigens TaxID=1628148 RepID=A0A1E7Q2Z0_9GAMM|nr:DUF1801 domain-containing protein [Rheinheimera salexigens]OEY68542.1 hypothetical protein BI198_02365 [Rheinheimera salexigens]
MAENQTQPTLASVDAFIAGLDNARRKADAERALNMYQQITGLPAVMWGPSIIGFGEVSYRYDSGREGTMPAAAFSPRKANMTFYVGDKFANAARLYAALGKHKKSVACLYINKLDDVDLQVLQDIIAADYTHTTQR